jgi:hypothetical protein
MEFFSENILWLFGAYLSGSVATYMLMLKSTYIDASGKTIDTLIEGGFLRHRKNADGEIEILKWNAVEEEA